MHIRIRAVCLFLPTFSLLCTAAELRADDGFRISVRCARPIDRETPVLVELERAIEPGPYRLKPIEGGPVIWGDVIADGDRRWFGFVLDHLAKYEVRWFDALRAPKGDLPGTGVAFANSSAGTLGVRVNDQPLLDYRTNDGPKPIMFPVFGPGGRQVTRAYPMKSIAGEDQDHPHQRSWWFTHGKVNGVDFWSEQSGHGSIKETRRITERAGDAFGLLRAANDWLGPDGAKICEDERVIIFYATKRVRVIDFDITLKATNGPLTIGDTKEGMFGLRLASTMNVNRKQGGRIVNAEGLTDGAAWGKASPWVDYSGPVGGHSMGVAILNHPASFRYPTTWHVRDYGLFAANPFGWHDFGQGKSGEYTVSAGESIRFRYRVILHEGDVSAANVAEAFRDYSDPPKLEIRRGG